MKMEEPEAYREGSLPFLGLTVYLDSRPLIPRPETEWWVEELIKTLGGSFTFLDLCAGSGAIGCSVLQQCPGAKVFFGEIDAAHKTTIEKNIRENHLDAPRADIRIGDLFVPFAAIKFDVIAANPPYVPEGRELPASVADYEPALALRAGPDGLAVIRRIAEDLPKYLKPGGQAWVECDSEHIEAAQGLFTAQGFATEIRTDQYERPRLLVISSK